MLLKSSQKIPLDGTYMKILYAYAAHDNTYVLMVMPSQAKDSILHITREGKRLFYYQFPYLMDAFGMVSNDKAIVLQTRLNRISILNLRTHEFTYITHQFKFQESDQTDIETFSDTKCFCVRENGQFDSNHFKLSYYYENSQKPFNIYKSQENQWTFEYLVNRANNHSMIAWYKPRQDKTFTIKTYHWRDNPHGSYQVHEIQNSTGIPYNIQKIETSINVLWEINRNVFCMQCISNKTDLRAFNPTQGVVNNNYIWNLQQQTVREANFFFDPVHNDYLIDCLYVGNISMFRTFGFEDSKALTTPVYYVHNQTEQIIHEETWECSYKHKYFIPGYDSSTIFDCQYENSDCTQITIALKRFVQPKELTTYFLLCLNQNFDSDLLQEVNQILDFTL